MYCLGIDTSNYTTSLALVNEKKEVIQRKKLLPVKKGEMGLRQSDAVFHHTQQLYSLYEDLVKNIDTNDMKAVGVSEKPRPAEGSYMPCFTVGINAASVIASTLNVPLYKFSHQEGHIAAALLSSKRDELFYEKFIAFHISGGTTEAVLVNPYKDGFEIEKVASTLDLNAGQAIDRVGVMLDLKFPCGAELEKLALKYSGTVNVKPALKGCDCCLSGLENLCRKMYSDNCSAENIAFFCIKYIEAALMAMTDKLIETYGKLPLVYAGGVMSNSIIRKTIQTKYNAYFAAPEYSSDNAAGIAYLSLRKLTAQNND